MITSVSWLRMSTPSVAKPADILGDQRERVSIAGHWSSEWEVQSLTFPSYFK